MRRTGLRVPGALLEYRGPDRWIERGIEFMNHRLSLILFTVLVVGGVSALGSSPRRAIGTHNLRSRPSPRRVGYSGRPGPFFMCLSAGPVGGYGSALTANG